MENILLHKEEKVFGTYFFYDENYKTVTSAEIRKSDFEKKCFAAKVFFCPKCHEMHFLSVNLYNEGKRIFDAPDEHTAPEYYQKCDEEIDRNRYNFRYHYSSTGTCVCPTCGYTFNSQEDIQWLQHNLSPDSFNVHSMKIFDVQDDKMVVSIFTTFYFPCTQSGQIAVVPVRYRLVFNVKTGCSFALEGRTLNNKHPKFDPSPAINNITFSVERSAGTYNPWGQIYSNKEIVAELAKVLLRVRKGKPEQLTKTGDFSDTTFTMLTTFNYMPYFSYDFYSMANKMILDCPYGRNPRDRMAYRFKTIREKFETQDAEIFSKFLFKGTKTVPKKAIRKMIFSNPLLSDMYKFLVKAGFKNQDVLLNFISNKQEHVFEMIEEVEKSREEEKKASIKFLKKLIKTKGEGQTLKYLTSADPVTLREFFIDTALMYLTFEKRKMMKVDYLKGSLKQTHDILARDFVKIRKANCPIEYSKKEKQLNDEIDGYVFSLAKDTYELIDIGQEMGICVGSYGDRAVKKDCIIVKMTQGNKYVGCIELDPKTSHLLQAKACFNNVLQETKAEALKKWVKKHKIPANNCYDYQHILNGKISYDENEIYQGHHNYANYYIDIRQQALDIIDEDQPRQEARYNHEDDDFLPF